MTHRVTAPLVVVVASKVRHMLYLGATLPSGVKSDDLKRLEREGYIEKVADQEPAEDKDQDPQGDVKPPAKSGPGSGKAAWQDYATSVGVTVDDSADRDDIVKAIAAAGKPTE